jgi:hypothetical protein
MKLSMFHTPKPKQFNYKMIYSSNEKKESQIPEELTHHKFKDQFKKNKDFFEKGDSKQKKINIVIYAIVAILLMYLIFFGA